MITIGLTGGIGSGKSLAADFFSELGITIIDSDVIAKTVRTQPHIKAKIIEHFGDREFSLKEIIEYIDLNPDVKKINYHCHQEWKNNQKMKTKLLLKS